MQPKTLLITNKTNIRYISGFSGSRAYLVLTGKEGFLFTDARYAREARRKLPRGLVAPFVGRVNGASSLRLGLKVVEIADDFFETWEKWLRKNAVRRVGFEGESVNFTFWKKLKRASKKVKLEDVGGAVSKLRIIKSGHELAKIKNAQRITDKIFEHLKRWLSAGKMEKEIAWEIESAAHEFGADGMSFSPIVAINENSAAPHHKPSDRRLKKGDMLLIDMGASYKGYCSDMTRVLFTKTPTAEQEKIFQLVLSAQNKALTAIKAGIKGKKADSIGRNVIANAGFGENFGHSLGHGVGLEIHELPNLSPKSEETLPSGAVVTVEPGVYLPGKFGIRIEDMAVAKPNGILNLTKSPKDLKSSIRNL